MTFAPVITLADLDSLDEAEMVEGYRTTQRGDPEPGPNRGRSFWHGWRTRMMDYGEIKSDAAHYELVGAWLARERERRQQRQGATAWEAKAVRTSSHQRERTRRRKCAKPADAAPGVVARGYRGDPWEPPPPSDTARRLVEQALSKGGPRK